MTLFRHTAPARLLAGAAMLAAAVVMPAAAQAAGSATVNLNDTGISPATVSIPTGGSVTFTNQGNVTHDAESVGGPAPFNTPGIGPGQSASITLTQPGIYAYTSGTDCLHGVFIQGYACGNYTIVVGAAQGAAPAVAPPPATPTPVPAPPVQQASASVTITDTAFAPAVVNVPLNGTVTWTNKGNNVHTATTTADVANAGLLPPFDTGGLGPGQSASVGFATPGTYVYFSSPDCFSKSNTPGFNCAYYAVVVGTTPAASPQAAAAPAPSVVVQGASASVSIDDVNGFQPSTVTIKAGQTVGWLNTGANTHSVVINQNPNPGQPVPWWLPYQLPNVGGVTFDSGGFAPQQSFMYTFTTPGTFPYHSSTDAVYLTNYTNCSCTFTTYKFFGTVVVTP